MCSASTMVILSVPSGTVTSLMLCIHNWNVRERERENFTCFCQPKLADHMCPKAKQSAPVKGEHCHSQPALTPEHKLVTHYVTRIFKPAWYLGFSAVALSCPCSSVTCLKLCTYTCCISLSQEQPVCSLSQSQCSPLLYNRIPNALHVPVSCQQQSTATRTPLQPLAV